MPTCQPVKHTIFTIIFLILKKLRVFFVLNPGKVCVSLWPARIRFGNVGQVHIARASPGACSPNFASVQVCAIFKRFRNNIGCYSDIVFLLNISTQTQNFAIFQDIFRIENGFACCAISSSSLSKGFWVNTGIKHS